MRKNQKMPLKLKKKISNSVKKYWKENRELKMKGVMKTAKKLKGRINGPHSNKWNEKISKSETGKIVSEKTKKKQSILRTNFAKKNPEVEKQRGVNTGNKLRGRKQRKEVVDALKKKWQNPEYKSMRLKQMMQFNASNIPEKKIIRICEQFNLPFKFVGNGKLIIDGYNPDFVSLDNKFLIEVFGDYWHNRKDWKKRDRKRFKSFSQFGYKTLVFWEHEIVKSKGKLPKYNDSQIKNIICNKDMFDWYSGNCHRGGKK